MWPVPSHGLIAFLSSSKKKLLKPDVTTRNAEYLAAARGTSPLSAEEIRLLSHHYRQTLVQNGISDTATESGRFFGELEDMVGFEKELNLDQTRA